MKKLLTLAVLQTIFLAQSCFGAECIKGRFFTTAYTHAKNVIYDIGYEYTGNVKVSIGPSIPVHASVLEEDFRFGILVNLHYYHNLKKTSIRPYISAGTGVGIDTNIQITGKTRSTIRTSPNKYFLPFKISAGASVPIFSSTNVFAGYGVHKGLKGFKHGIEFGISRKL